MTTVSVEVQNAVEVNTDEEDMYHYIPDESDEYSQPYMDVKGQVDIHKTSDIQLSGNQASEEHGDRVGNESGEGQHTYTGLILEEIDKETPKEIAPQIYSQLKKKKNRSNKQDNIALSKETNTDAHNQFYVNSKVVQT